MSKRFYSTPKHSEVKFMKVPSLLHINKNLPPKFNNSSESGSGIINVLLIPDQKILGHNSVVLYIF